MPDIVSPGRLYFNEEGRALRARAEELGRFSWARKLFRIEEDGLDGTLLAYLSERQENSEPLTVEVGGEELVLAPGKRPGPGFRWREIAVPGRLLRRGEVEVVFRSANLPLVNWALGLESANEAGTSFKSSDRGRTWQRERMASDYSLRGEYLVRLWIPGARRSHWDGRLEFRYDDPAHGKYRELARAFGLEKLLAGREGDYAKLVALRDHVASLWVHHSSPHAVYAPWDAPTIVALAQEGTRKGTPVAVSFCVQFAITMIQFARACGLFARGIVLECDHPDFPGSGHFLLEGWCGDLGKWVLFDPDFGTHYAREGKPLGTLEMHRLLDAGRGGEVTCIEGPSFGTNPYIPRGFHTALPLTGITSWGVLLRNDFFEHPEACPVEHGMGGHFREACFVWWDCDRAARKPWHPYYPRDEAALCAPPERGAGREKGG